jgi:hypothetical protein
VPYRDDERRKACVRESVARTRAAARGKPGGKPSTLPSLAALRFKTARDVLRLLNSQVEALLEDEALDSVTRARALGYMAALLLRAVETGELEDRLTALEATLNPPTKATTKRVTN